MRGLFDGLFKKNKSSQEQQEEAPAATGPGGERSSTRRGEASQSPATVDLSDQVVVKSNKTPDDWMMGVQGLQLTLSNRSSTTVTSARVEVSYYSEQNDLLQKKTVSFANVGPKKSQTVAAPDHRMADRVEYTLLSATGEADAYARQ